VFSNLFGTFAGRMALLVTTILVIRALPRGITGLLEDVRGGT
jgi:branched-chain amino acid transport system permease protein